MAWLHSPALMLTGSSCPKRNHYLSLRLLRLLSGTCICCPSQSLCKAVRSRGLCQSFCGIAVPQSKPWPYPPTTAVLLIGRTRPVLRCLQDTGGWRVLCAVYPPVASKEAAAMFSSLCRNRHSQSKTFSECIVLVRSRHRFLKSGQLLLFLLCPMLVVTLALASD